MCVMKHKKYNILNPELWCLKACLIRPIGRTWTSLYLTKNIKEGKY
jgi:hypothetical protein